MTRAALEAWIELVAPGHSPDGSEIWRNWIVRLVVWLRAAIHPEHATSSAVARSIGLAPTTEVVDGEVVWRGLPPAA
jgi:hypothetical protein